MPWIESHSTLIEHHKVRKASTLLNIDPVLFIGHLHCFWHKVIELREDGNISDWTDEDIAYYARWKGNPKEFLTVITTVRLIEQIEDLRIIHDWLDYSGLFLIRKYSSGNPKKLHDIWKLHGYKYGKGKGKYHKQKANIKANTLVNLPNQPNQPNQPNIANHKKVDLFKIFWDEYPKKVSKKKTVEIWTKLDLTNGLMEKIMTGLSKAKESKQWQKDNGEYIPHPTTWLNGRRWEDQEEERKPAWNE